MPVDRQSRMLFVKNLSYNTKGQDNLTLGEDLYELFGRYGAIRQIRLGNTPQTRGTAYIVFEEMGDAKSALTNLNGFHLQERYIVVYITTRAKFQGMEHYRSAKEELLRAKQRYGMTEQ